MLEVEVIAWKALFVVARGEIDADAALMRVMESIPWAKLDTISDSEHFWFQPGREPFLIFQAQYQCYGFLIAVGSPRRDMDLRFSDIDGEVPIGWPLTLTRVTEVHRGQQSAHSDECQEVGASPMTTVDKTTSIHPGGVSVHVHTYDLDATTVDLDADAAASEDPSKQTRDDTMDKKDDPPQSHAGMVLPFSLHTVSLSKAY